MTQCASGAAPEHPERKAMKNYLQYSFFIDGQDNLIPCDRASEDFIALIDEASFVSHIKSLQLNNANTSTTILINYTSYTLRVVPVSSVERPGTAHMLDKWADGYIVVLQDQVSLSAVMHTLTKNIGRSEKIENIFEDYDTGIYVTRADGVSMFINSRYEEITGVDRDTAMGQTIFSLSDQGMFMPLVTPVILKINKEYTVFQTFAGGRYAIISGTPIYDSSGEAYCVLICINQIEERALKHISGFIITKGKTHKAKSSVNYIEDRYVDIIAESAAVRQVLQDSIRVAHYDVPVLLLGESGTGKEVFASIIHSSGQRRFNPYVTVNCSAITSSLLEAELFGYEAGAFTGASSKGKPGLFEVASSGTILLDEVGDLPLESQAKILRVLQNGEFYRVGGVTPIKTNARIIAATNRDLKTMVDEGRFRNDLYYRLNVIPITMPALRDRREDIAPLLLHFLYVFNQEYGTNKQFSSELINILTDYNWPGNVRELKNMVKRLIIMSVDDLISPHHFYSILSGELTPAAEEPAVSITGIPKMAEAVGIVEKTLVERALEKGGNTRKAAEILGVSQTTVMRKIKEYNLEN